MRFGSRRLMKTGIAAIAATLMSLSACSTNTVAVLTPRPPSSKLPHVHFAIPNPVPTGTAAPYTSVPKALGYWEQEGLLVDLRPTRDDAVAVQALLTGEADIAIGSTASFYRAAAQSSDIKVVSLQEKNTWQLIAPEGSPITSVADLNGKTIGVGALDSLSYALAREAVSAAGLDPNTDVTWRAIGVGATAAAAIEDGSIAAYASYGGTSAVVLSALGNAPVDLQPPVHEVAGLTGIATTNDYFASHGRLVMWFLRGVYEGYVFSELNPAAALQIHWQAYPQQKSADMSIAEAISTIVPTVKTSYVAAATTGADGLIGGVPMQYVQDSIDFMVQNGILNNSLDAHSVVDLSKVRGANVFDLDSIKTQADTWNP